jgi:two-component system, OmpR family, response regulator
MELKVFVVEDFPNMRILLSDLFQSIGRIQLVGSADTEAEARLWLDEHQGEWDVAIVDLVLNQGSGFGVVSHANGRQDPGKVVVLSSFATPGVRKHCMSLGAAAVFDKGDTVLFSRWMNEQASRLAPAA